MTARTPPGVDPTATTHAIVDDPTRKQPHSRNPAVRCTGTNRDGTPCNAFAIHGGTRCRMHGGQLPRVKAAAARRVAEAKARRQLNIPEHVDPRDALAEELARTIAWVRWLGAQVDAVDDTALIWGRTKEVDKIPAPEVTEEAKTSMWWSMLIEQRKHLLEVAKAAHACGVEDRRVEIQMQQAEILVGIVTGMVADLGLDMGDPKVRATVAAHLRRGEAIEAKGIET